MKKNWIARVDQSPIAHAAIRVLRLREMAGAVLGRFPIRRRLSASGTVYRARGLEGLAAASELFSQGVYDRALEGRRIRRFVDLGCNVGFFPCLLADRMRSREIAGLIIDANQDLLSEARWHLQRNGLDGVIVAFGLVGAVDPSSSDSEFYLCNSHLASSQFPLAHPARSDLGNWKKATVPCIRVEELWQRSFGDQRIDLLKVDIEGSEESFFRHESQFLDMVDSVVLEIHEWLSNRKKVDEVLASAGLRLADVLADEGLTKILYYRR